MLKFIETIPETCRGEALYIWNVNRDAADLFLSLAFRLIDVQGFIDPDGNYQGQTLLGRPVLSLADVKECNQPMVIFNDMAVSVLGAEVPADINVVQYSAMLRCHPDLTDGFSACLPCFAKL